MKILHIGNIANVPYLLCYGLRKYYEIDSYLLMPRNINDIEKKLFYGHNLGNPYKVPVYYISTISPSDILFLIKFLIQGKFDIIHSHHPQSTLFSYLFTIFTKSKLIQHFHGSYLRELKKLAILCLNIKGIKILVSTPDLLYATSKKMTLLPNPIDPIFEAIIQQKNNNEKIIFLPTRHDENKKSTSIAFKAWSIVREVDPEVKLVTIKWGNNYEDFYNEFKKDERVIWLPVLTKNNYVNTLRLSSIVWGQFRLGSLGMIEIEAMYIKKPVITFYNKKFYNIPEPFSSNNNPTKIAQQTCSLLNNQLYQDNYIEASYQWVDKNNSLKIACKKLYKIYKDIL